jgi:hypothetical protein
MQVVMQGQLQSHIPRKTGDYLFDQGRTFKSQIHPLREVGCEYCGIPAFRIERRQ